VSAIPSPHALSVRRYRPGAADEFNNAVPAWDPAVPWYVRSVDPVSSREPGLQFRDMTNIDLVVQADKTPAVPGYRDRVVVDGLEYDVDGQPDDWTRGPWPNPAAGVTVYLKRTEG
jgi:hypothetical protein